MELVLNSIGTIRSQQIERYQAGRQPDQHSQPAIIQLNTNANFEQALIDLGGCTHLWIIFGFHHNENWKPLVQTPRSDRKIGVFATRAPYRPNPLGLSCVSLVAIDGLNIEIGPNDMLDGTPVYDIKPYLAETDVVQNSQVEWLAQAVHQKMKINISPMAEAELDFLEIHGVPELRHFIFRQLEYDPENSDKKRVVKKNSVWTLSYRTWRIDFVITDDIVGVIAIRSGYSKQDLQQAEDKYLDKDIHKLFLAFLA